MSESKQFRPRPTHLLRVDSSLERQSDPPTLLLSECVGILITSLQLLGCDYPLAVNCTWNASTSSAQLVSYAAQHPIDVFCLEVVNATSVARRPGRSGVEPIIQSLGRISLRWINKHIYSIRERKRSPRRKGTDEGEDDDLLRRNFFS